MPKAPVAPAKAKGSKDGDAVAARGGRSSVQSVSRAFAILDILKESSVAMSALDVSRASGLDRTVVHRLLRTLAGHGMVVEERGSYGLGPASVLLANGYLDHLLVRRLALPYLLEIQSSAVGEKPWPVALTIPVDAVVTVIERIWTRSVSLDVVLDIGDTFDIDLAAAGRAVLAYREEQEARALIGDVRYEAVAAELEQVRESGGLGFSRGEASPGISAMAAAILNRRGQAIGAISVSGIELGDQMAADSQLAGQLRRSARAVGQSLP